MNVAKTRVFFVNRYFYPDESATSQLLADLVFNLATCGFEVHVICSRQLYATPTTQLPAEEILGGVSVHRIWTTRFGRHRLLGRALDYLSFYATCALTLLRRLQRADIVVAMTDPPLISIIAAVASKLKRSILVNWLQDVFPEVASHLGANPLPEWLDRSLRALRDYSLRSANVNVLIGSRMLEYFSARGLCAARSCVIENWADANAIVPKHAYSSVLRQRLSLLSDKLVVCYSGNLGRAHEFTTLLGAAEALRADPSYAFLMIGGGFKMGQLRRAVEANALSSFHFLPYQPREQLEDSLATADVHIVSLLPELEGLIVPSKLYGILAAGRPLIFIGDSDGEVARVVRQIGCGTVVAVNAAEDLVRALYHLQAEPATRVAMGERAREALLAKYSLSRGIEKWIAVLDRSMNRRDQEHEQQRQC